MIRNFIVVLILLIYSSGCTEEYSDNCRGYVAGLYKKGNVRADGNYMDLDDYAIYIDHRKAVGDTWEYDYTRQSIFFETITDNCIEKMYLPIGNLKINSRDTVYLVKFGNHDTKSSYSLLEIIDHDTTVESYELLEDNGYDNWIKIDDVSKDRKEIRGTFELNFISTYEPYLTGERERWDDPDRPNILRFTNGQFTAKYSEIFEK